MAVTLEECSSYAVCLPAREALRWPVGRGTVERCLCFILPGGRACLPRHGVRVLVGVEVELITAAVCGECLFTSGPCTGGWKYFSIELVLEATVCASECILKDGPLRSRLEIFLERTA